MNPSSNPPPSSAPRLSRPIDAYARFIGTWEGEGEVTGTTSYEWLPGGYFIVERVSLVQRGHPLEGVAVIGQARASRGAPSPDVVARFYDSEGNSIDYVYELSGDHLTIWIEERGSDAVFEAELEDDSTVLRGRWRYPGGTEFDTAVRKISDLPDFDPMLALDLGKSVAPGVDPS